MKYFLVLSFLLVCFGSMAQTNMVSTVYAWKQPKEKVGKYILSTTLVEGSAYDMAYLQVSSNAIFTTKKALPLQVPDSEEHLLFIKEGKLRIQIEDSTATIGDGSLVLLMPGEKYSFENVTTDTAYYFLMKYRSKQPVDLARGKSSGGSKIFDWNKVPFKLHDRGGRKDFFNQPTAMCKRFEMHTTSLKEGLNSHDPHTHRAEEIVLIIEGKTEMQIGDQFYKAKAGDLYYLGSNVLHGIHNDGAGLCTYYAFQFE